jgi:exosome complex component RRP41
MIAVGVDGCKQIRNTLDGIVRQHGNSLLKKTVT